jgi:hypothetical protein
LLQLGISKDYLPLQEETLALLCSVAEVMNDKFAAFYSTFMPGLLTILKDTPMETKNQKELRSNCIQAIGCILESVADKPEVCHADAREVTQIITELMNSGKLDDSDPQILTIQRTLS